MMCMGALVEAEMKMGMCMSRVVVVALKWTEPSSERRLDSIELSLHADFKNFESGFLSINACVRQWYFVLHFIVPI